jgi:uncharacterized membrane protein
MDILSFILGMSAVVVIAVAIVAVVAFVKVNRTNKDILDLHKRIDDSDVNTSTSIDTIYRDMKDEITNIQSQLDSRYDKLDTKINSQILKK